MRQSRLSLYIFLSLLLHVLLLLTIASGLIKFPTTQVEPDSGETTLTLLQETPLQPPPVTPVQSKPQSRFVPTMAHQETDKPNPNALLESERNTALRTDVPNPRDPNSPMPDMQGDKRSSSYVNTPGSAGQGQQPPQQASQAQKQQQAQPQMTQAQPQPTKPPTPQQQPPQDQPAAQAQAQPQPAKPKPITPRTEDAMPLLPPEQQKPSPQTAQQSQQPQQQPSQASPQQASRPPPASFAMTRGDSSGGAGIKGLPSPEARDTELGRYKQKMYRAVGSRWYLKVQSSMSFLAIGTVRVKFYVRANGVLENVRIAEDSGAGNSSTEMLRTISLQSVVESAPFEPFSETMKQQLGAGYDEEFTFSIY